MFSKSAAFCQVVLALIHTSTFLSFIPLVRGVDRTGEFLNNLKLTHWDDWGVNVTCPRNLFITGLNVKTVEVEGQISVNGIQIICSDEINPRNKATRSGSLGRPSGNWNLVKKCKAGFVVGLLPVLSPTAVSFPGSSIQSLQVYCSDEVLLDQEYDDGMSTRSKKGSGGTKDHTQYCDTGDAVVGLTVKADSIITVVKGDTAAVKNILMECRPVASPANHYNIEYNWQRRKGMMKCIDLATNGPIMPKLLNPVDAGDKSKRISISCSYESWTGIGLNSNLHRAAHAMDAYGSMGLNNNKEFVKWALLRRIMSEESRKWFLETFSSQPRLLDNFAEEMLSTDVKNYSGVFPYKIPRYPIPSNLFKKMRADPNSELVLKHDPMFEQYVGNCAMYQISFALFRANHHIFIETLVNKRMTRIVFSEYDMAKM